MSYFSSKPAPTPGSQLPFPKSNKIVDKEKEAKKQSLKRKQNGGNAGLSHSFMSSLFIINTVDLNFKKINSPGLKLGYNQSFVTSIKSL